MSAASVPLSQPLPGASLPQAVSRFFRKYATFSGRASRSEYWWVWLTLFVAHLVGFVLAVGGPAIAGAINGTSAVDAAAAHDPIAVSLATVGQILLAVISLATVVPMLALTWRRLHDGNRSGAAFFVALIPLIGTLILLEFLARASKPEGARFDVPPALNH
jgi:uncharacterized membrane protein YhaH (DUF805 family)